MLNALRRLTLLMTFMAFAPQAVAQSMAIEPRFELAGHFHQGLAPVREGGLWGFIDRRGGWVISPRYEGVLKGVDGRFGIKEAGLWGFIDTSGEVVVPPRYEEARPFKHGVAAVSSNGSWGFIDTYGGVETAFDFLAIGGRDGQLFTAIGTEVWYDGTRLTEWRIFRAFSGGKAQEPCAWDCNPIGPPSAKVYGLSEGAAVARLDQGETLIGEWNSTIPSNPKYFTSVRRRSEGWAAAELNGRWGYITEKGEFYAPRSLEKAREFSDGVAPVKTGGRWGYMDKRGQLVFSPRFDAAYSFHEGYATMRVGELRGFLKKSGSDIRVYLEPQFEDVYRFQEGLAPIKLGGRWGYLSNDEPVRVEAGAIRNVVPQ